MSALTALLCVACAYLWPLAIVVTLTDRDDDE